MKVALGQIRTTVGDVAGNEARLVAAIEQARRGGAELVVFPELALVGYPPGDLLWRPELLRAADAALLRLARVAPELAVVVGAPRAGPPGPSGRTLRNAAVVLQGGRIRAEVAKRLLPADDVFFEPRWFTPGAPSAPLELGGRRVGLLVCEDLWDERYADSPAADLIAQGADLLVAINASPFRRGVLEERLRVARRPGVELVYVNAVGGQDELVFDGSSFVLGPGGELRALAPCGVEAVDLVTLGAASARPLRLPAEQEQLRRVLVAGIRDFLGKQGLPGVLLGVSGGVDSALVACLAVEALGPERVRALSLPSRHTSDRSRHDARALCEALGVELQEVPLEPLHRAVGASLADLPGGCAGLVDENVQSRLRGLLLMAWVNRLGGLVLNTSNKTELSLGYGTLYGDLIGGLSPLGDLTKPEVYALARGSYGALIPAGILDRPPSAELAPGQVDPFDYPRLAPLLEALVQEEDPDALVGRGYAPEEVQDALARLQAAEFKRRQAPPVLKVQWRSFGPGRLVPLAGRTAWSPPAAAQPTTPPVAADAAAAPAEAAA